MAQYKRETLIAAAITFLFVAVLTVVLFVINLHYDPALLARESIPEPLEEEELFIEPEIIRNLGEEQAVTHKAPAPQLKGEPEKAEKENTRLNIPDKNTKPAPQIPKPVTQTKESPVQATTPPVSDEEKSKVTSAMAKGFSGRNGAEEGTTGTSGAGGTSTGVAGSAAGRTFLGCPSPDVALRHKTTVTVMVVIDAEGKVVSAKASGGSSASIRSACEQAARRAKWSAKKGAAETRGSITFTITPR